MKRLTLLVIIATLLTSIGYFLCVHTRRETIFDRVILIPQDLVLKVPEIAPLCDQIGGLRKSHITVDGGSLYCEQEGSGVPLLLISGGPGETHHAFHPYFSQAKDVAHIIYYDQRGTGKSTYDDTGLRYSVKQAVDDIEALRIALHINQWVLLGWSYGGLLAQCYALNYPEHVKGLVLVASVHGLKNIVLNPGRETMFLSKSEQDALEKIHTNKSLNEMQRSYNLFLAGDWKRQAYYKPTLEQIARMARYDWNPAPGFNRIMAQNESHISLDHKFHEFEVPTLLIEAMWDLTWDADKARVMRKNHPKAQYQSFEKSGHTIFADEPQKFFALLKSFLASLGSDGHTSYKADSKIDLPPCSMPELSRKLLIALDLPDADKKDALILSYYQQAVKDNFEDLYFWRKLASYLVQSRKHYQTCLHALQKYESSVEREDPDELKSLGHCLRVLQGQMNDLLGKRDAALQCYKEALLMYSGVCDQCKYANQDWLRRRLEKAFTWDDSED